MIAEEIIKILTEAVAEAGATIQRLSTENERFKAEPHYTETEIYQKGRDDEDKYQFHLREKLQSQVDQLKKQLEGANNSSFELLVKQYAGQFMKHLLDWDELDSNPAAREFAIEQSHALAKEVLASFKEKV